MFWQQPPSTMFWTSVLRAPVKLPQQMKPAYLPGADGEDLVPYLYYFGKTTEIDTTLS